MHEIVKYHNDFNRICLPNFTEQEYNILMGMLSKLRSTKAGVTVEFSYADLLRFCGMNYTRTGMFDIIKLLRDKFFKADFTRLIETETEIGYEIINLFDRMIIYVLAKDGKDKPEGHRKIKTGKITRVVLSINPRFEYILNDLFANFTQFELEEFFSIRGKYSKILYQHLKQFRKTGLLIMNWSEFVELMGVPEGFQMRDIDNRILKPAIKELLKPRTLFDQDRIIFTDLKYEKIKEKGTRGRGGKVVAIRFTFTPEADLNSKVKANKNSVKASTKESEKIKIPVDPLWEEFKKLDQEKQKRYINLAIEMLPPSSVKNMISRQKDLDVSSSFISMIQPQILKIFKLLEEKK